ncbi:unnamed protein product, partial [Rotaria magnacalcarata]
MVRKKTTSSKVKSRKEAYKRKQQVRSYAAIHSWRILLLTIKAVHKFSRFKHRNGVTMCVSKRFSTVESDLNHSDSLNYIYFRPTLVAKETKAGAGVTLS